MLSFSRAGEHEPAEKANRCVDRIEEVHATTSDESSGAPSRHGLLGVETGNAYPTCNRAPVVADEHHEN